MATFCLFPIYSWANDKENLSATGINTNAVELAMKAYKYAMSKQKIKPILTIVDFSEPSQNKRMIIYDLKNHTVLYQGRVSHGKGSGFIYPIYFSNKKNSYASSLGIFVTGKTYYGGSGYSLRISGIEKGINNKVKERHIVFHSSHHVSDEYVERYHHVGRSLGCFAISPDNAKAILDIIRNGTVVFAYAEPELHDPYLTS